MHKEKIDLKLKIFTIYEKNIPQRLAKKKRKVSQRNFKKDL